MLSMVLKLKVARFTFENAFSPTIFGPETVEKKE